MRIIMIGAVAAGTSAAAKARRNNDQAEIVIYEKDKDISYSGCGLPHYIITPNLDEDMAAFLENSLKKKSINIMKNTSIVEIKEDRVIL